MVGAVINQRTGLDVILLSRISLEINFWIGNYFMAAEEEWGEFEYYYIHLLIIIQHYAGFNSIQFNSIQFNSTRVNYLNSRQSSANQVWVDRLE